MSLLILGGTADGRKLADQMLKRNIPVIYSVAGLVRTPDVSCSVISGGFSKRGGLLQYLKQNSIFAILDATHPYALKMSTAAIEAAQQSGIPCWRFQRHPWEPRQDDKWTFIEGGSDLEHELSPYSSVFLTCGQLNESLINKLGTQKDKRYVLRTASCPQYSLPDNFHWIKAIGPFGYDDEYQLMKTHSIDVLVSKNSGGASTQEKLRASRQLNIPVLMFTRPTLPPATEHFFEYDDCVAQVSKYYDQMDDT